MTKFKVNSDTWLDQAARGAAHGNDGSLKVNNAASKKYPLLHVSVPGLEGSVVQSATLHIFLRGGTWASGNIIKVDLLTAKFKEGATWHSYQARLPSLPGTNQGTETLGGANGDGHEVEVDITDLMAEAAAAENFYGFLVSTSVTSAKPFYSSEAQQVNKRPFVTMVYAKAPPAPTDLHPQENCSAQKTLLSWETTDQAAYQIQIDALEDGDSPDFGDPDGDFIATETTEDSQADTDALGWAGLADNASTSWRVRVQNTAGAVSEWSAWVSFTRQNYETLVIDFPAVDLDDVDATTPQIEWTSANQAKFQILVTIDIPPDAIPVHFVTPSSDGVPYNSTVIGGDDGVATEFVLPAGVVTEEALVYYVEVRVWDDVNRDAPGEQRYVSAVRSFEYAPGNVTAAIESLTASVDGPAVVLTWTRSASPDSFLILAGDDVLYDEVEPSDVFVSGTTYSKRVYGSPVGVSTEWKVRARVAATGDSQDGFTASATFEPISVWLTYEPEETELEIMGEDEIDMDVQEDGATFFPLASRAPVRVGGTLRGYIGEVSGTVEGAAARDELNRMKQIVPRRGNLRLTFGSFSFPIVMGDVNVSQWPRGDGGLGLFDVSFQFWQVGAPWPA